MQNSNRGWTKDVEYRDAREEEKTKTSEDSLMK